MQLSRDDREKIFAKTCRVVEKQYFDPQFNGRDWPGLVNQHKQAILEVNEPAEFERAMHELVRKLGTSHTGVLPSISEPRSGPAGGLRDVSQNRDPGRIAMDVSRCA